ncbi:MAG: MBL fold hydrolase [Synechococcus sp.]|nr:MAG: MBL fold hydrolase [Synechococcus sp.]
MTGAPASDEFRINERCIDCGTCWTFDPDHFAAGAGTAVVAHQPVGEASQRQALLALQACPVAAIETSRALQRTTPADGFPSWICSHAAGEVFYCGWASHRSFGARSWLIQRADGNVMVDVPRWSAPLARRIEVMGGLAQIVLTHRDDVADHQRWAQAFACERWIHRGDADAAPSAEQVLEGQEPLGLAPQIELLPTPGHTPGSLCLLLGDQRRVLFSGDHVWWNRDQDVLVCSERYCAFSTGRN